MNKLDNKLNFSITVPDNNGIMVVTLIDKSTGDILVQFEADKDRIHKLSRNFNEAVDYLQHLDNKNGVK